MKLLPPSYITSNDVSIDFEDVAPPTPLTRDQLLQVDICSTYAVCKLEGITNKILSFITFFQGHGYCHAHNCAKSHDIMVAVDLAHLTEPRKRRRLKGK